MRTLEVPDSAVLRDCFTGPLYGNWGHQCLIVVTDMFRALRNSNSNTWIVLHSSFDKSVV